MYDYKSDLKIASFSIEGLINEDGIFNREIFDKIPQECIEETTSDSDGNILEVKFKDKTKALQRLLTVCGDMKFKF